MSTTAIEPMVIGRVYWKPDDEGGTVLDMAEHWITIDWDLNGVEVYAWSSGAIELIEPRIERFSCEHKR
jgi:hypothetical protein